MESNENPTPGMTILQACHWRQGTSIVRTTRVDETKRTEEEALRVIRVQYEDVDENEDGVKPDEDETDLVTPTHGPIMSHHFASRPFTSCPPTHESSIHEITVNEISLHEIAVDEKPPEPIGSDIPPRGEEP